MNKPIGILGGTFDPIHFGHLRPALEAMEGVDLAEIRFIPCRQPAHRGLPQASPEQRLAMLERAVLDQPGFVVDTRELLRSGPSFMVDTLTSLRQEVGAAPLCLLLGTDAFDDLHHWRRWRDIPELAHLLILHRPGRHPPRAPVLAELVQSRRAVHPEALRARPAGSILFQPVTQLDISGTRIRATLARGHSPRFLLPDAVLTYIDEQSLYRPQPTSA